MHNTFPVSYTHLVDAGGYEVFAIVPASDWSINVYSSEMTEDASYKDYLDSPLYKGSPDERCV